MAMKSIHAHIKKLISTYYKTLFFIVSILFLSSCVGVFYSNLTILVALISGFSLATMMRMVTYKTGHIPLIMIDSTWNRYRLKYPEDELDERYKEMSINRASVYFMIAVVAFVIWILCEILVFCLKL